jgi:hypothetical protein
LDRSFDLIRTTFDRARPQSFQRLLAIVHNGHESPQYGHASRLKFFCALRLTVISTKSAEKSLSCRRSGLVWFRVPFGHTLVIGRVQYRRDDVRGKAEMLGKAISLSHVVNVPDLVLWMLTSDRSQKHRLPCPDVRSGIEDIASQASRVGRQFLFEPEHVTFRRIASPEIRPSESKSSSNAQKSQLSDSSTCSSSDSLKNSRSSTDSSTG